MGLNKHAGVAIAELVLYFPALLFAVAVCARHGLHRSSGWIYTLILCQIRIVGACCQLASTQHPSRGLIMAVFICDSVGMSPLLLATLGLLSRSADAINPRVFTVTHFRLMKLPVILAAILAIVGGKASITDDNRYVPQTTLKAGVILYVVVLLLIILIAVICLGKLSNSGPKEDRRLVWTTIAAFPFIAVRLLYSVLTVFSHFSNFRPFTGSVLVQVFVSLVEEFVVVLMYLIVGWMTQKKLKGEVAGRPWESKPQRGFELGGRRGERTTSRA